VLSFLSNENCFAGHFRGLCGPHVAEHHWARELFKPSKDVESLVVSI